MSTPTPAALTAAAASTETQSKGNTTTAEKTEKTEDQTKIDITAEPQPAENVALPNPATQSTYQRVEKGTRTALLYWDGWLSAQDARLAEEDPNYFGKSVQAESSSSTSSSSASASTALPISSAKQPPRRNTNLKKNWTYGKNGDIVYINTGFVGMFDKASGGANRSTYSVASTAGAAATGSNTGSSYGNLSNYGAKNTPLPKSSGPSVGTTWDLKGNPQNRSAYADVVTSSRAGLTAGNNNQDASFYSKSDAKVKRNAHLKKNWTYGKNGEVEYIATGFVGLFDKGPGSGNRSTYSAVGGSAPGSSYGGRSPGHHAGGAGGGSNTGSSYGNLSNYGGAKHAPLPKSSGPSVGTTWDLKGNPQNRSAYADVVTSGRSGLTAGANNNNQDDNYYSKSDGKSKGSYLKKNWAYGKNNEIVYIATGFVGLFDKPSDAAPGVSPSSHGASSGTRSSYSNFGGSGPSGSSSSSYSPVAGHSGYGNVAGGAGKPAGRSPGSHAVGCGGNTGSSYGNLSNYGGAKHAPLQKSSGTSVGTAHDLKGNPQNRSVYSALGSNSPGAVGSSPGGSGGGKSPGTHTAVAASGSNTGSSYGGLPHYSNTGGKHAPLPKSSGPSVGTTWDLKGNPQNRSAYADVVTSGRSGLTAGANNNNQDDNYFSKSDTKVKGMSHLKKNWTYGKNHEIVYLPTGFVGTFDKHATGAK
uniref:Uncharacterized protein n=1 Tax=Panagrolaimus superbus TaxID=310955 RepID=A0A914Y773_9BILA